MSKLIPIHLPTNFKVELDDNDCVTSVACEINESILTFKFNEPLKQSVVNKAWANMNTEEKTPSAQEYAAGCFQMAIFLASRTHHIRNIMNNFEGIFGELTIKSKSKTV